MFKHKNKCDIYSGFSEKYKTDEGANNEQPKTGVSAFLQNIKKNENTNTKENETNKQVMDENRQNNIKSFTYINI